MFLWRKQSQHQLWIPAAANEEGAVYDNARQSHFKPGHHMADFGFLFLVSGRARGVGFPPPPPDATSPLRTCTSGNGRWQPEICLKLDPENAFPVETVLDD